MELLQIENLSFRYPGAETPAVDAVSFSVHSGEFVVVCGESGCGKTTLLRLLKPELAPAGELTGTITYAAGERTPAEIGYVLQNPDSQIVTDKVWHELAFGLENLGVSSEVIRRRVGEMASYFGIQDWFRQKTDELSGGQKQLLNLTAVMVMQPKVLILDEPTRGIDVGSKSEIYTIMNDLAKRGVSIIMVSSELPEILNMSDRVIVMRSGRISGELSKEEATQERIMQYAVNI